MAFYTGAGVFNFGEGKANKDYKNGDKLPSGLPAETLASMLKNGKASDTEPVKGEAAVSNELGELRGKVKAMSAQLATVTGERDAAGDAASRLRDVVTGLQTDVATVTGERDAARETIAEMTKAQLNPPAPSEVPDGAGPAAKK